MLKEHRAEPVSADLRLYLFIS